MPDIRERFERNTTGPVELGSRPDHIPDTSREIDIRLPFMPGLPNGFRRRRPAFPRAFRGARAGQGNQGYNAVCTRMAPELGARRGACGAVAAAEMSPPIGAFDRQAVEGRPCLAAIESRIVLL
jgi:hypothetical protein